MTQQEDKYASLSPNEKKLIRLLKFHGFDREDTLLFMHHFPTDEKCAKMVKWIEEHEAATVEDIMEESFRMDGLI